MALAVTYTPYKPGTFDQPPPAASNEGEGSAASLALSAQIRALPEYAAFQKEQSTTHQSMSGGGGPAQRALAAKISQMGMPDDLVFDMQSGQIRDKEWVASHPMLFRVLVAAGFLAGGAALAQAPGLGATAAGGAGATATGTTAAGATTAAGIGTELARNAGTTATSALVSQLVGAGLGALAEYLRPPPRQSFSGTSFDPVKTGTAANDAIAKTLAAVMGRAGTPIDLSNAVVGPTRLTPNATPKDNTPLPGFAPTTSPGAGAGASPTIDTHGGPQRIGVASPGGDDKMQLPADHAVGNADDATFHGNNPSQPIAKTTSAVALLLHALQQQKGNGIGQEIQT